MLMAVEKLLLFAFLAYSLEISVISSLHQSLSFFSFPSSTFFKVNLTIFFFLAVLLRYTLVSVYDSRSIRLTMHVCLPEVSLSVTGSEVLVASDANDKGTGGKDMTILFLCCWIFRFSTLFLLLLHLLCSIH